MDDYAIKLSFEKVLLSIYKQRNYRFKPRFTVADPRHSLQHELCIGGIASTAITRRINPRFLIQSLYLQSAVITKAIQLKPFIDIVGF